MLGQEMVKYREFGQTRLYFEPWAIMVPD